MASWAHSPLVTRRLFHLLSGTTGDFYRLLRSCSKAMFLNLSVSHSVHMGCLCPEGVSVWGMSLSQVSLSGGLCPGRSLSRGSLSWGSLCPGVSVQGASVQGGLHLGVSVQGVSIQEGGSLSLPYSNVWAVCILLE